MPRRLISSGSSFEQQIGYSRAVVDGDWIFVSGTTGFDYATMTIADSVVAQTEQALKNIEQALHAAGASLADLVRVTYVLPVADDFPACWPVLQRYFGDIRPAAMMISAGLADPRMRIEIEVTAYRRLDAVMTTETSPADAHFDRIAAELGHSFAGEIRIGGNYAAAVTHGRELYISGQIPRVGDSIVVSGRAGVDVDLTAARQAAQICAMRALAIARQTLGSLADVEKILRLTVYVQCGPDFTQHSEVADAASDILHAIFGTAGLPTRTSVGVYQLPKNATVELDMIVATRRGSSTAS